MLRNTTGFPVIVGSAPVEVERTPASTASDTPTPIPGQAKFWSILSEKIAIEALYGVNYATVVPALLLAVTFFGGNLPAGIHISGDVFAVIEAGLGALNAFMRGMKDNSGNGNLAIAIDKANQKAGG